MISNMQGYAQNKVSVSQQGKGNKAIINQSNGESTDKAKVFDNCDEARLRSTGSGNTILVKKAGHRSDTLLYASDKKWNIISDLLFTRELTALQQGADNELLVVLPDTQKTLNRLATNQNGMRNHISARLKNAPDDINLTQTGAGNSISINPCDEQDTETKSGNNSVRIEQDGTGNSAHIVQH